MGLRSLGFVGLFLIIFLFRIPTNTSGSTLGDAFYDQAVRITEIFEVHGWQVGEGYDRFRFWDDSN